MMIDISSELPGFTRAAFAELLKREDELIRIAREVLDELAIIRSNTQSLNLAEDDASFEIDYLKAVIRKWDELELFGLDLSPTSRRHRLSAAYVTLSIEEKESEFESSSDYAPEISIESEAATKQPVKADQALSSGRLILIRGQAGSGKTTLLQWAAVRAAH